MGCHFLLQEIFPDPGIEPESPVLQADSLLLSYLGSPYWSIVDYIVLVSGIEQNDSVIYIYMYPFFFKLFLLL